MFRLKMEVITAMAAWALTATCNSMPGGRDWSHGICPRGSADYSQLQSSLSSSAQIYYPNSTEFDAATARWSVLDEPTPNVVVVPGTENDVAVTVNPFP